MLPFVGNAAKTLLAPTPGLAISHVVRRIRPGLAVGAIVFARRSPLPFGKIRAPFFPVGYAESFFFHCFPVFRSNLPIHTQTRNSSRFQPAPPSFPPANPGPALLPACGPAAPQTK